MCTYHTYTLLTKVNTLLEFTLCIVHFMLFIVTHTYSAPGIHYVHFSPKQLATTNSTIITLSSIFLQYHTVANHLVLQIRDITCYSESSFFYLSM